MKTTVIWILFIFMMTQGTTREKIIPQWNDYIQIVIDSLPPLTYDRGNRLPLFISRMYPGQLDDETAVMLVNELDNRGVGIICRWSRENREETISKCMTIARAQKKLGKRVNISANPLLYSYFDGDEQTAHIDEDGKPFFDDSFGSRHKMGCPFAIDFRKKEIRERVEFYVNKYKHEGLPIDFIYADWEIDGPHEFNRAFEASKKCTRCREHLRDDFSFNEFQKTMREMRSYLQYYGYSAPVLSLFPDALIGNYALYPNDGYRYWYDFFEYYVEGQPYKADQHAKYRQWYNDFPTTGYTMAMPVVYTWFPIYNWYDFDNPDYRWFYNMLLVASNAGKSTPRNIPIVSFVTWNTVWVQFGGGYRDTDPAVKQMRKESYQELLWHMLLRGTNTFFIYSAGIKEFPEEVRLVHQVYSEAQQYGDFLENGFPITYDVPDKPGTVISGLAMGNRILIRRTDFGTNHEPVEILAGTKVITVEYAPGICQIIDLDI